MPPGGEMWKRQSADRILVKALLKCLFFFRMSVVHHGHQRCSLTYQIIQSTTVKVDFLERSLDGH